MYDYLRKSGAKGYVVSLSGGCDSSTCATLVAHSLTAAARSLGLPQVVQDLGIDLEKPTEVALRRATLACLYQPTKNSSAATKKAASALASALGCEYFEVDVDDLVSSYQTKIEAAIGRVLSWQQDDLTLQNIQARARAPMAWLVANTRNAVLLTTSNRSEAAVGLRHDGW